MSDSQQNDTVQDAGAVLPLSRIITLAEISPRGLEINLKADSETLAALARLMEVDEIRDFKARINLAHEGADGIHATGLVQATIRQACGVTLELFDAPLSEEVDVHFVPAGTPVPAESLEDESYDPPDEIENERIDVGALAVEFLALGIDLYPRKPDAVFELPEPDAAALSPFSALSRLKDPS